MWRILVPAYKELQNVTDTDVFLENFKFRSKQTKRLGFGIIKRIQVHISLYHFGEI
jgi:hypothetical protein